LIHTDVAVELMLLILCLSGAVECVNEDNIAFLALPLECQWVQSDAVDDDDSCGGDGDGRDYIIINITRNSSKFRRAVMLLAFIHVVARPKLGLDTVYIEYSLNCCPSSLKACAQ
jgi:hypothetical protein